MPGFNQKSKRDLLFWSGGKDAFLALCYYRDTHDSDPALLTTYDDESGLVPHQELAIEKIRRQAVALGLIHFAVPLSHPVSNDEYMKALSNFLKSIPFQIGRLIFGDLHLQDIREWRETQFQKLGFSTEFPIWNKPLEELITRLEREPVVVRISSVMDEFNKHISPGDTFNREFVEGLPYHIDPMGENGEFHTEVEMLP
jgi:diphthamide synthase (EF-2-diphthine--ammonia ligase)